MTNSEIFITETDVFGEGKLIYHIERINKTTGNSFKDGEHIIYVNSSYFNENDNSDLAKPAHDFLCSDPDEMYLPIMAENARYYKTTSKGVDSMCKSMEDRIKVMLFLHIVLLLYYFNFIMFFALCQGINQCFLKICAEIIIVSKRLFGEPKFNYYAVADDIFEILKAVKTGISKFFDRSDPDPQLSLFGNSGTHDFSFGET